MGVATATAEGGGSSFKETTVMSLDIGEETDESEHQIFAIFHDH